MWFKYGADVQLFLRGLKIYLLKSMELKGIVLIHYFKGLI